MRHLVAAITASAIAKSALATSALLAFAIACPSPAAAQAKLCSGVKDYAVCCTAGSKAGCVASADDCKKLNGAVQTNTTTKGCTAAFPGYAGRVSAVPSTEPDCARLPGRNGVWTATGPIAQDPAKPQSCSQNFACGPGTLSATEAKCAAVVETRNPQSFTGTCVPGDKGCSACKASPSSASCHVSFARGTPGSVRNDGSTGAASPPTPVPTLTQSGIGCSLKDYTSKCPPKDAQTLGNFKTRADELGRQIDQAKKDLASLDAKDPKNQAKLDDAAKTYNDAKEAIDRLTLIVGKDPPRDVIDYTTNLKQKDEDLGTVLKAKALEILKCVPVLSKTSVGCERPTNTGGGGQRK